MTDRDLVELFHLLFLRALAAKAEDKRLFALKGGCNLRFYLGSPRYSEDIDLDVTVVAPATLENRVDRLLASPLVQAPLKARRIELVDVSKPKQTATTQRWKAGLRRGSGPAVRTKIEFSRREAIDGAAFEAIDAGVASRHALPRFLAPHYGAQRAAAQKIAALAGRSQPQARDVFDLHLLLARPEVADLMVDADTYAALPAAVSQAMSLGFDEHVAQVVAYLEPEQADLYGGRDSWDLLQGGVVDRLQALGPS